MASDREDLAGADVIRLRDRLATGALSARDLAEALIDRIAMVEPEVGAFVWFDPEFLRAQAAQADAYRKSGRPIGPLHGLPVGIKDVINTAGIPTENGTPLDAGRRPEAHAAVVSRLLSAGALVLGKTVTTELQFLHPSSTRNPANTAHTPGGSSAGSAAAVASGMAPLAIGTQTGGSIIRPASYCGCVGYKPTFGSIPSRGVLAQSPSLDTVGVLARDTLGAALLADSLFGSDPSDPSDLPRPAPGLFTAAGTEPPVEPTLAFVDMPGGDAAHPEMKEAMAELIEWLGECVWSTSLPKLFSDAARIRSQINDAELAHCFRGYAAKGWDRLSSEIQAAIERGRSISVPDYLAALDLRSVFSAALDEILLRADALLVFAASGPAPAGYSSTGDSIFNDVFTFTGHPTITLPVLTDSHRMPMGAQLVGRRGDDARLLRTANWLETRLKISGTTAG